MLVGGVEEVSIGVVLGGRLVAGTLVVGAGSGQDTWHGPHSSGSLIWRMPALMQAKGVGVQTGGKHAWTQRRPSDSIRRSEGRHAWPPGVVLGAALEGAGVVVQGKRPCSAATVLLTGRSFDWMLHLKAMMACSMSCKAQQVMSWSVQA